MWQPKYDCQAELGPADVRQCPPVCDNCNFAEEVPDDGKPVADDRKVSKFDVAIYVNSKCEPVNKEELESIVWKCLYSTGRVLGDNACVVIKDSQGEVIEDPLPRYYVDDHWEHIDSMGRANVVRFCIDTKHHELKTILHVKAHDDQWFMPTPDDLMFHDVLEGIVDNDIYRDIEELLAGKDLDEMTMLDEDEFVDTAPEWFVVTSKE